MPHDIKLPSERGQVSPADFLRRIELHLQYTRGRGLAGASDFDKLWCLCHAVRDFALDRMIATERAHGQQSSKDRSGLGSLIGVLKRAAARGGDVKLARPRPSVKLVLEITRANKIFNLCPTVEEALAAAGA